MVKCYYRGRGKGHKDHLGCWGHSASDLTAMYTNVPLLKGHWVITSGFWTFLNILELKNGFNKIMRWRKIKNPIIKYRSIPFHQEEIPMNHTYMWSIQLLTQYCGYTERTMQDAQPTPDRHFTWASSWEKMERVRSHFACAFLCQFNLLQWKMFPE